MTVVPDGPFQAETGVPGPGERPQGTRSLRRGVPAEGSGVSTGASRTSRA